MWEIYQVSHERLLMPISPSDALWFCHLLFSRREKSIVIKEPMSLRMKTRNDIKPDGAKFSMGRIIKAGSRLESGDTFKR